ncbi:sensor histidine kinase [Pseudomarimonas arenosa]|uniref:histidine kinase n=1 Tax=Pseudomarimonas arenosa TaxID=2774145 RepID=A0AAW3ZK39_9GAMM|nr:ATP-binding protein [Pseudomarimonas arenosa]MBD8526366.1 hypothetical protein [Pseudomarimonas arenosa]
MANIEPAGDSVIGPASSAAPLRRAALLPFYVPIITVTLVLALLFAFGVREQEQLRLDHIERVLGTLEQAERQVARHIRNQLNVTERSLARYQDGLQRGLAAAVDAAMVERFQALTEPWPDGSVRSRRLGFDGRREAGIWLPRGLDPTPALQQQIVLAKQITDQFGRGAQESIFADTWWLPAAGGIVFFGPGPDLAEFVFQAEADFSYAGTDWMQLVHPHNNPQGELRWTPLSFDPTPQVWMFSAVLPLRVNGVWLGSVGHDVPLQRLLQQVEALGQVEGSGFVLVDAQDRVLASDLYAEQIVASAGRLDLNGLQDQRFLRVANEARRRTTQRSGGDFRLLDQQQVAFISHLAEQDWLLINLIPLQPITGPVQASFARLRDLTLWALLLELLVASGAMWWNHRQTQRNLRQITAVHQQLAERERHLARLNETLEQRVQERTEALSQAKLRAEQALQDLRNTQHDLLAAEKMAALGQLVAGVSHEINTPIGIALTAASHLQSTCLTLQQKADGETLSRREFLHWRHAIEEGMRLILGSLQRANELIASFKQVAVDQSSDGRREFELHTLLHEAALSLRPLFKRTGITLELNCEAGIQIDGFPGALFQILSNCVNNSLLHGFAGRDIGHVVIQARQYSDDIELRYQDDGVGMSAEVSEHAFEPFFTTRRGRGGSGLGLHIVFNLVTQLLGGSIELDSSPGNGVILSMRFPRKAPPREKAVDGQQAA